MGELVPDTPSATAEPYSHPHGPEPPTQGADSFSQSYLHDAIGGQYAAGHSMPASLRQADTTAGGPADDDEGVDELADSIPDSQLLPPDDEASSLQDSHARLSSDGARPVLRTRSALVLGPDDHSGYSDGPDDMGDLGETQAAHSLNEDSWRSHRARRASMGGREPSRGPSSHEATREEGRTEEGLADESSTMDFTRAAGRVLPSHEPRDHSDEQPAATSSSPAPRPSESQKENPSPCLPPDRSQANQPFSLSVHSNLDDASGAPSSSPAVARELLRRRSPKKAVEEPASSADPDLSPSVLLSSARASRVHTLASEQASSSDPSGSDTASSTSTPAFANMPPPAPPVTATRTLPTLALAPEPLVHPAPISRSNTLPTSRCAQPALVNANLFASSAAMKADLPARKKRKAEAWDGISQSDESVRTAESLGQSMASATAEEVREEVGENVELPPTLLHEEPEAGTMQANGRARDKAAGMAVDEETLLEETVRNDESVGGESVGSSLPAPLARRGDAGAAHGSSSLNPVPRRDAAGPTLFNAPPATASSTGSSPGSRSPVKADGAGQKGKKRLSDISELKSSGESPSQAIEVPATQTEYDALRPASLRTQDVEVDKSSHASFQHDTSTDSATTARRQSMPAPGRELKRPAPPPTPAGALDARPASQSSSSASTSRPNAVQRARQLEREREQQHDHGADLSTLPQATQHAPVPESSPDVPLARGRLSSRFTSPALPRRGTTAQGADGSSAGVVVPDSDGPTQEDLLLPEPATAGQPAQKAGDGNSRPKEKGKARAEEPAMEVEPQPCYEEFGGGFNAEGDQEMRDAGVHNDDDEDLPPPHSPAAKGKAEAKHKPKPRTSVEPPGRVAKKVVAAPKPNGRGKGKGKARALTPSGGEGDAMAQEESLDALDLLRETNYSIEPSARNSKTRPARSAVRAPPAVKEVKGKRRATLTPPVEAEDEGDVDGTSPRKKRRTATVTPVVEIPPSRVASPYSSPAKKSALAEKVVAAPQPKAKTQGRRTNAKSTATASPEPPVAGPSRARFRSVERSESVRTVSPALAVDSKPSLQSRLLPTAPFTRVLAFWRVGDVGHYPGTVLAVTAGKFDVLFDDGSRGKIKPDEICHCELVVGDRVSTFGHEATTETQAESLDHELVVTGIERGEAEVKEGEGFAADDTLVVDAGGRTMRLPVSAVRVCPRNARQLDDRRLTGDDLALFEGKERARPRLSLQRLNVLKPLKIPSVAPMRKLSATDRNRLLFGRTAFIVSSAPNGGGGSSSKNVRAPFDRVAFVKDLEEHGATVIDWQHLFKVKQAARDDAAPELVFRSAEFAHIEDIFLLTNRACQTSKYLVSLALGVPCLSKEFAVQSMAAGALLDWRPFLLTAGFMHDLGTYAIGSQLRALAKTAYGLDSLREVHAKGGVFKDKAFVVVMRKSDKAKTDNLEERSYAVLSLLACATARTVHFVDSVDDARSASGYDFAFVEDDALTKLPAALKGHRGLVNMVWLKQCLMAGRLLPAERMKQASEE